MVFILFTKKNIETFATIIKQKNSLDSENSSQNIIIILDEALGHSLCHFFREGAKEGRRSVEV